MAAYSQWRGTMSAAGGGITAARVQTAEVEFRRALGNATPAGVEDAVNVGGQRSFTIRATVLMDDAATDITIPLTGTPATFTLLKVTAGGTFSGSGIIESAVMRVANNADPSAVAIMDVTITGTGAPSGT